MIANPKNTAMKDPLTHEEKRRLLQLLYLEKQSHNEHSEDFAESKPSVYTWPPAVPEDYDELLACGPKCFHQEAAIWMDNPRHVGRQLGRNVR